MGIKELISISELAAKWKVHRRTVRRLLDEAGISPVFLSRKKKGAIRYRQIDIERFVAESMGAKTTGKGEA